MVWDGAEAVTVEQVPSPEPVKHTSSLGSRYRTEGSASEGVHAPATARIAPAVPHMHSTMPKPLRTRSASPHPCTTIAVKWSRPSSSPHRSSAPMRPASPSSANTAFRRRSGSRCASVVQGGSDSESVCDDGTVKRGSSSGWAQRKVARTVLSNSRTCSAARAATVCSSPSRIASSRSMCSRM